MYYLGAGDLPDRITFVDGGENGHLGMLTSSVEEGTPTVAVVSCIAQIDRRSGFLRPTGSYNSAKPYNASDNVTKAKIKLSANQATDPEFLAAAGDWDKYLKNIARLPLRNYKAGAAKPSSANIKLPLRDEVEPTLQHDLVVVRLSIHQLTRHSDICLLASR